MKDSKRNSRIRLLVKHLNCRRKKQAAQIDLLCNDIIKAHSDFIDTVRTLSFAAEFYELLIGIDDLDCLLYTSARLIKRHLPDANLVFFITHSHNHRVYAFDCDTDQTQTHYRIERYFTNELVTALTRLNKPCGMDELLQMGLQVSPAVLKDISAGTMPIAAAGSVSGFILIYQDSAQTLNVERIKFLSPAGRGLSRAIRACVAADQAASHRD
jgi:hypothetical protein